MDEILRRSPGTPGSPTEVARSQTPSSRSWETMNKCDVWLLGVAAVAPMTTRPVVLVMVTGTGWALVAVRALKFNLRGVPAFVKVSRTTVAWA
jgi:hypothetical protein